MTNQDGAWETVTRNQRWCHCKHWPGTNNYLFVVTDEATSTMLSAELTLPELMELREWIGVEARSRTTRARGHSGS